MTEFLGGQYGLCSESTVNCVEVAGACAVSQCVMGGCVFIYKLSRVQ